MAFEWGVNERYREDGGVAQSDFDALVVYIFSRSGVSTRIEFVSKGERYDSDETMSYDRSHCSIRTRFDQSPCC